MIFSLASEALKEGTAPRPKNHKAFFLNDHNWYGVKTICR